MKSRRSTANRGAPPPIVSESVGPYLDSARLVGRRTAERYIALAADQEHADFKPEEIATLLNLDRLEKAIYELAYKLDNRPDWVHIPLAGIQLALSEIG
ncbi:MAG: hypothetical protein ABIP94_24715 [Planctomycetota bacterium]